MSIIPTTESRLTAVTMMTDYGPALFICVYMPTNYGDYGCYENYVELCCKITAIYNSSEAVHLVIAGNFNCSVGSRFYKLFADCARENDLRMTDICRLGNTFTYYNSDGSICTWIDHVLSSSGVVVPERTGTPFR